MVVREMTEQEIHAMLVGRVSIGPEKSGRLEPGLPIPFSHGQHWAGGLANHVVRGRSEKESVGRAAALHAHHDQIAVALGGDPQDFAVRFPGRDDFGHGAARTDRVRNHRALETQRLCREGASERRALREIQVCVDGVAPPVVADAELPRSSS
jgi:hypothetical protein